MYMSHNSKFTIANISAIISGRIVGSPDGFINNISIDSRSLAIATGCLFFALKGKNHNANKYIKSLYQRGFKYFVVDSDFDDYTNYPDASFILVENSLVALQCLCKYKRNFFKHDILAITGSNGKTIVKEFIFQILSDYIEISRSPKSYNSQVGVPLSLWNIQEKSKLAIIEAGISLYGEMQKHSDMIMPDLGLFTSLGDAHGENFESKKDKLDQKLLLFNDSYKIFYCADDVLVDNAMKNKFAESKELATWSRLKKAKLTIVNEKILDNNCIVEAIYKSEQINISIPFTDFASIDNCIHAWLFCLDMGVSNDFISNKIKNLTAVAMRMEIKEAMSNCIIINDYYNSDIDSLPIALDLLNQQAGNKKRTILISDIQQNYKNKEQLYKEVASLIKQKNIHRVIGIGPNISEYKSLFPDNSAFFTSTDSFIKKMYYNTFSDEIILLRGAREFHLEKISNIIETKNHRTVLEVDLNALVFNLNYYRSLLNEKTKICVMVKAFSYGCGSIQLAKVLEYQRVDYLAVAIADEGIELRKAGINIPIIVMNPEEYSFYSMIENSLEPEIYSISVLDKFAKVLIDNGIINYPIHLKLDTGMQRMGFVDSQLDELIRKLKKTNCMRISSIFSHLAYADSDLGDKFTYQQIELFDRLKNKITCQFDYQIDAHILNTAGIERFTKHQYNMVRLGIGLYGSSCSMQSEIKNVCTLRTNISQIKEIKKNTPVGYSCTQTLARDSKIAIIPIGYADGFNRRLSNGVGKVYIKGILVPVVGRICMDMSMIDVTDVDVSVGASVIIFGKEYPVSKQADLLETITYEVLTGISSRVKRMYSYE